jgi:hypothetical protein
MRLGITEIAKLDNFLTAANELGSITSGLTFPDANDTDTTVYIVYVEDGNTHVFDFPASQQQAS